MAFDLDDEELYYTRKYLPHEHMTYQKEGGSRMILPERVSNKKKKETELTLGTAYDINKTLVKKYEKPLTTEELKNKKELFKNYIQENYQKYYMLLCNDKKDYTVFHIENSENIDFMFNELQECLTNRGKIYGFDRTQDGVAIEI